MKWSKGKNPVSTWKDELEYLLTISGHRRRVSLPAPANNKPQAARTKAPVQDTPVEGESPLKSLASRIKDIRHALRADELAELLQMSRRGTIPSFRVGGSVRFDPAAISKWLLSTGMQSISTPAKR